MTLALNVQNRNYLLDPKVMYTLGRGEGVDILVKHAMRKVSKSLYVIVIIIPIFIRFANSKEIPE